LKKRIWGLFFANFDFLKKTYNDINNVTTLNKENTIEAKLLSYTHGSFVCGGYMVIIFQKKFVLKMHLAEVQISIPKLLSIFSTFLRL